MFVAKKLRRRNLSFVSSLLSLISLSLHFENSVVDAQRERVRNNVRRLSTNPNGPKNATIPRGREAKSRVQRSRRATRLGVLRKMRHFPELEIELVRRDVFEPLRVEVHGKWTGDFRENARTVVRSR